MQNHTCYMYGQSFHCLGEKMKYFNSQNVVTILGSTRYFAELRNFAKKGRYLNCEIIITKWSTTFYYAMMQPHHIAKKMKFHVKVSCSLHKQNLLSVIFSWKNAVATNNTCSQTWRPGREIFSVYSKPFKPYIAIFIAHSRV